MDATSGTTIGVEKARTFLDGYLDGEPSAVEIVGEGAWSRCFGFTHKGEELVIRFGRHVDDFLKDERAFTFAGSGLPIPEVLDIGCAFDGHYAISRRVHGVPLERVDADGWRAVIPSLTDALEAMRTADLAGTQGFGGWGADGRAPFDRWSQRLLSVADDTPDQRTHGWRARLAANADGDAVFRWGYELLQTLAHVPVPRSLVHGDLINRNVLVDDDRLSGVFDWGCSVYGDHLYDLAWFEFWSPWFPDLDMGLLRSSLEQRWDAAGYVPHDLAARLAACYLHIGLDHLAYNAYLNDSPTLTATADRMKHLVSSASREWFR